MPARKPSTLSRRHDTKADKAARDSAENALTPKTSLTQNPPSALKGHPSARATWKRIVGLYFETEGTIVTAFDQQVLISYCKLIEEELNLETKVKAIDKAQKDMLKKANKIKPTDENYSDWVSMWQQVNTLTANFLKMDARLDGKRKHRLAIEQSLYLTPRSRAGVSPKEKEDETPKTEMEKWLSG